MYVVGVHISKERCFRKSILFKWLWTDKFVDVPSDVMILLAFLSCFLVFFFIKDQIASFQLKQIIVFLNCFVCVFISLRDCDRV